MKKLNKIVNEYNVIAFGFKAFIDYAEVSNKKGEDIVVSTLSPAVMAEMGINIYYAPVLPRGAVYNTADDVANADLSVNQVAVYNAPDTETLGYGNVIIVSNHNGTIDILKEMYPDATVLSRNVTQDDIRGAFVAGTLPPHLIQYAMAYKAVTVNDFDYTRDNNLSGQELRQRIHICSPIAVEIN